ncbi:hypothetical protein OsI_12751 [Oryza sativa Indica Group]|uniref:Uncharacterized protein n=1 Tax=Oryza sativa subsp. indica TaxID=39946 RepID=A2XJY4_ORYSI|nr:hypothetical protein OsI_12751 [Oryza sativa Indica Group]
MQWQKAAPELGFGDNAKVVEIGDESEEWSCLMAFFVDRLWYLVAYMSASNNIYIKDDTSVA